MTLSTSVNIIDRITSLLSTLVVGHSPLVLIKSVHTYIHTYIHTYLFCSEMAGEIKAIKTIRSKTRKAQGALSACRL